MLRHVTEPVGAGRFELWIRIETSGVGGFSDIITRAPKIVYSGYFTAGKKDIQIADGQLKIISDGAIAKFVPDVAQVSFSGRPRAAPIAAGTP